MRNQHRPDRGAGEVMQVVDRINARYGRAELPRRGKLIAKGGMREHLFIFTC